MRFTIEAPALAEYRNVFVISAHFMSGDADSYRSEEWEFATTYDMDPVVQFLTAVDAQGQDGHHRLLDNVPWRRLPCSWAVDPAQEIPSGYTIASRVDWPRDSIAVDYHAAIDSWTIAWYDEAGRAWDVRVEP